MRRRTLTLDVRSGGSTLRSRRKQADLTIEDVKRDTGLEVSDISRLENGRVTGPSLEKAMVYGTYLGMTPNDIARAYKLWGPPKELLENRFIKMLQNLAKLPEEERDRLVATIERLISAAIYEQGAQSRDS
jgi:transcriptional regulator with XRE-family HTH domain